MENEEPPCERWRRSIAIGQIVLVLTALPAWLWFRNGFFRWEMLVLCLAVGLWVNRRALPY